MSEIDIVNLTMTSTVNIGLLVCTLLALLMQPAMFLFQVGSVSRLNAINDFYKGVINLGAGALVFHFLGWDILRGESFVTPLMVEVGLAAEEPAAAQSFFQPDASLSFLLHLAMAITAASICSGAVAGRMRPYIYSTFAIGYIGVAYPIFGFSVWHPQGILFGELNDFAGSVVVHGMGATSALAATMMLRPRVGFNGFDPVGLGREQLFRISKRHAPHNIPLAILGGVVMWVCWIGLTCGVYLANAAPDPAVTGAEALPTLIGKLGGVAEATLLAAATAGMIVVTTQIALNQFRDVIYTLRAAISGAVAVSAGVHLYTPDIAILVGLSAGLLFLATSDIYRRLNIDDPVASIAAHGPAGVLGVVAAGLITGEEPLQEAVKQGAIGVGMFLAMFVTTLFFLFVLGLAADLVQRVVAPRKRGKGGSILRISYKDELEGVDIALHGQDAYSRAVDIDETPERRPRAAAR